MAQAVPTAAGLNLERPVSALQGALLLSPDLRPKSVPFWKQPPDFFFFFESCTC